MRTCLDCGTTERVFRSGYCPGCNPGSFPTPAEIAERAAEIREENYRTGRRAGDWLKQPTMTVPEASVSDDCPDDWEC